MSNIVVKDAVMKMIDGFLDEKPRKLSKDFYQGVTEAPAGSLEGAAPGEKVYALTKESVKSLIDLLAKEVSVDIYVSFVTVYNQLLEKEKAAIAAAEAAAVAPTEVPDEPTSMRVQKVPDEASDAKLENVD